jgi:hypothetical protein
MQKSIGQRWTNKAINFVPNSLPIKVLENKALTLRYMEGRVHRPPFFSRE